MVLTALVELCTLLLSHDDSITSLICNLFTLYCEELLVNFVVDAVDQL